MFILNVFGVLFNATENAEKLTKFTRTFNSNYYELY